MKVAELYAGSRSIGKAAEKRGHEVFSVDIEPFEGIDLVMDIEELKPWHLPWIPDMIWFGIPCTTWSQAGIAHHRRNSIIPVSDFARKSDRLLEHNLILIELLLSVNPNLVWYFENPRGNLRKMPQMQNLPRTTVWYCQYGDNRAKPTDIWTNNLYELFTPDGWNPRPPCRNYDYDDDGNVLNRHCHHDLSPRGKTVRELKERGIEIEVGGTQYAMRSDYDRSKMPEELCLDIILQTEKRFQCKK